MLIDLKKPLESEELKELLISLYGSEVSVKDFVETSLASKDENLSLIQIDEKIIGYCVWEVEIDKDEDDGEEKRILVIDELVIKQSDNSKNDSNAITKELEKKAKLLKCSLIDLSLPSQSFHLVPFLAEQKTFELSALRVTKELTKKTEFIQIYNKIGEDLSPQLIEVMVSKDDAYHLELIDEPSDYKSILEKGYNPEIISMIFEVEENNINEVIEKVKTIAEWEEYTLSFIAYL